MVKSAERGEYVGFSRQVCCVYVSSIRIVKDLCKDEGLTYYQLASLLALEEACRSCTSSDLADYLMLRRESVWDILLGLEDMGLAAKANSSFDARYMSLSLSPSGRQRAGELRDGCLATLRAIHWRGMPEDDFYDMMTPTIKQSLALVRGAGVPTFDRFDDADRRFSSGFLVFWEAVVSRWSSQVKALGGVALGEFRILHLLRECGAMSPGEASHMLAMPKSSVTRSKDPLVAKGYVKEEADPADSRGILLTATPEGERLSDKLEAVLDASTREMHGVLTGESAMAAKAWHYLMYRNLMR